VTRGRADRPPRWVLDLGLDVESGHRPWLHTLAGAPLALGALLLVRLLTDMQPPGAQQRDPDLTGVAEKLSGILSVLSGVLAGIFLVAGIVYRVVGRYAYGVWRSLPEEERQDLARERLEALRTAIVALGGEDPESLGISEEDLEDLSDRHRALASPGSGRGLARAAVRNCAGRRGGPGRRRTNPPHGLRGHDRAPAPVGFLGGRSAGAGPPAARRGDRGPGGESDPPGPNRRVQLCGPRPRGPRRPRNASPLTHQHRTIRGHHR